MSPPAEQRFVADLFQEHGPMVYRRALRLLGNPDDAQEATQEVFIRAMKGAEGFRGKSQTTTWLYRITTNYCLNQIRDRKRRRELFEEHVKPDPPQGSPARSPAALVAVRRLLSEADPQQAQAVVYVYLDGMSHSEAAKLLDVSKRTVGNLLDRFRAWAQALEEQSESAIPEAAGAADV